MYVLSVDSKPEWYTTDGEDVKEDVKWHTYHTKNPESLVPENMIHAFSGRFGSCESWSKGEGGEIVETKEQDFYVSDPTCISHVKDVLLKYISLTNCMKIIDDEENLELLINNISLFKKARGICVFRKHIRKCVSVFFHTVYVDDLIEFMNKFGYNKDVIISIQLNKDKLRCVPWDVCIDLDPSSLTPTRTAIYSVV
jgi:hypothetical protein